MTSLKSAIETTTNVALLAITCLILWVFVAHRGLLLHSSAQASDFNTLRGRIISHPPGYEWKKYDETLVLALRSGCHFCSQSMPFYQRLSHLEQGNRLRAHLLVVMPDPESTARPELSAAGVNVESIFGQPLASIRVSGTPTLLLVDSAGHLKDAWVGQLQPEQEQEVVDKVKY